LRRGSGDDELSSRVRRKTTALKDIDSQLGNFNKQNRNYTLYS